ncbi:MAG: hypothetical protein KGZ25_09080 [Planctomycetes bacterium]|nr:hypothetical protein [Planctomycetota bacterium]
MLDFTTFGDSGGKMATKAKAALTRAHSKASAWRWQGAIHASVVFDAKRWSSSLVSATGEKALREALSVSFNAKSESHFER